jgi:hypothetical protein
LIYKAFIFITNPVWNDLFLHGHFCPPPPQALWHGKRHALSIQECAAPMFQFAFDGELFTLKYREPALRPLFTLPPDKQRAHEARTDHRHLRA